LPQDIARERAALFTDIRNQQPMLQALTAQYRSAVGDTTALVGALTGLSHSSQRTLEVLEGVITAKSAEGRFDITRKLGGAPIRTWGQLGLSGEWAARTILVKGPSSAQGVYGVFRSIVLAGGDYRLDMHPEPVASSIVQA
jgi:hypothetical protein